tara:strand:+ start:492 stop:1100 length:609 start_codon:yes stop_codon:yes gene_type:complete
MRYGLDKKHINGLFGLITLNLKTHSGRGFGPFYHIPIENGELEMKLSENLSLSEITKSNTARRRNISNEPTPKHLKNLKHLAENGFQPIREHFGVPVYISSGYRSEELNSAIGGALNSHHKDGNAIDLDQDGRNTGVSNADIFWFILDNMDYTELIYEFGDDKNPGWVHYALVQGREKEKKTLRAIKVNGRTKYIKFDLDRR